MSTLRDECLEDNFGFLEECCSSSPSASKCPALLNLGIALPDSRRPEVHKVAVEPRNPAADLAKAIELLISVQQVTLPTNLLS
jgi:hypothetical protein